MEGTTDRIDPDAWRPVIMGFQKFYGLGPQVHPSSSRRCRKGLPRPLPSNADEKPRRCESARSGAPGADLRQAASGTMIKPPIMWLDLPEPSQLGSQRR